MVPGGMTVGRFGRRTAGVTLTEVVVASTLLVVSMVPLLKALAVAQATGRIVERRSWSLMLAQSQLDRIRAQSVHDYDHNFNATSTALGDGYLCCVSDDRDPNLRKVTVSVGLDANGDNTLSSDETEVRLCTYLARRWPGPQ
jgi:Tfp pilus assembly protein PilV